MKTHKVGETKPNISKDQALFLHSVSGSLKCTCCDKLFGDEDQLMAHVYNESL